MDEPPLLLTEEPRLPLMEEPPLLPAEEPPPRLLLTEEDLPDEEPPLLLDPPLLCAKAYSGVTANAIARAAIENIFLKFFITVQVIIV